MTPKTHTDVRSSASGNLLADWQSCAAFVQTHTHCNCAGCATQDGQCPSCFKGCSRATKVAEPSTSGHSGNRKRCAMTGGQTAIADRRARLHSHTRSSLAQCVLEAMREAIILSVRLNRAEKVQQRLIKTRCMADIDAMWPLGNDDQTASRDRFVGACT